MILAATKSQKVKMEAQEVTMKAKQAQIERLEAVHLLSRDRQQQDGSEVCPLEQRRLT